MRVRVISRTDPLLGSLGNYGGSTRTLPLLPGSAAINAGNATYCTLGHDQRGVSYVGTCDLGAFESQGFTPAITSGNDQSTIIDTAFPQPLGLSVTSTFGEPVDGGRVTFAAPSSGASANPVTNTVTISGGAVSQNVTANSTPGLYTVTASASGASNVSFSLRNRPISTTTTTLTSLPNPSTFGASVTFTAQVSPILATGTVTFKDNGADIAGCVNASLSSGQATCVTSSLAVGSHPNMTAQYSGDADYDGSTSSTYSQTVNQANTNTTLTSSPNPSTFSASVMFTATVTDVAGARRPALSRSRTTERPLRVVPRKR